jgi:putative ABC transport system permease protein
MMVLDKSRKVLGIADMALLGLMVNWRRSSLSMLGIVIGVFGVIVLASLGNGVQKEITGQLTGLGPNLLTAIPGNPKDTGSFAPAVSASTLTPNDVQEVASLSTVAAASGSIATVALTDGGDSISLTGVDPSYAQIRSVNLLSGRFVQQPGEIVLDEEAAKDFLQIDSKDAVGRTLKIKDKSYAVVGVAKADSSSLGLTSQTSFVITDDALATSGEKNVGKILAEAKDADSVKEAQAEIEAVLKRAHGGTEDFVVKTQEDLMARVSRITGLLAVLLYGISILTLLVAGIGIMNIMLASVTERTKEIGIRKALGATNSAVLLQFLFEALILTSIGGIIGIGLGLGVSFLLPEISPSLPTSVTGTSIVLAFGVAALVGLVFGGLPAYRAARLEPTEALRREL